MKVKGTLINYNRLCGVMYAGEDKVACRIIGLRTVGFLECKSEFLDEVDSLEKLQNESVKTLKLFCDKELIGGMTCGQEQALGCTDFLVK